MGLHSEGLSWKKGPGWKKEGTMVHTWGEQALTAWKKSYDKTRQHIKKERHHFADRCPSRQSYGFSSSHVWMWEMVRWTVKKAEHQGTDVFELWCWRRLLRVPWTARRSNQSILKEISPEYSLEGLMLKLKLQYFGHLMPRTDSLEKTPMLGKIEGRRRGQQRIRWLKGITNSMDMSLNKLRDSEGQGSLVCCSPRGHKDTRLSNWTTTTTTAITTDPSATLEIVSPTSHLPYKENKAQRGEAACLRPHSH